MAWLVQHIPGRASGYWYTPGLKFGSSRKMTSKEAATVALKHNGIKDIFKS
jgi:hypothetical protein